MFFVTQMDLTRYGASGVYNQAFIPETIPSPPPPQSTTDLHTAAPTTVKDRITAMNTKHTEEQSTVHSSTKQMVSHQKYTRSKTPMFELVLQTEQRDELRTVFKRRSSKELDTSGDFEEYVQQKVLSSKQRTKMEELQQTYIPEQAEAAVYRKQQQLRYYMQYGDSQ